MNQVTDLIRSVIDEPVLEATQVDPGYPNTNSVWRIKTESDELVLKISGHGAETPESCFWYGMRRLFGCNPESEMSFRRSLSDSLNSFGEIPVPEIRTIAQTAAPFGSAYTIERCLPGTAIRYGSEEERAFVTDTGMMHQFGRYIAKVHTTRFTSLGNFPETANYPTDEFRTRLSRTVELLASRYWQDDREIADSLDEYIQMVGQMPTPEHISLIMPDMTPGQFLTDGGAISGLVDIESYVRGPIELELAAIELWMSNSDAFVEGYSEIVDGVPDISAVRRVYRFFLYLLYRAPPHGLDHWIDAPVLF